MLRFYICVAACCAWMLLVSQLCASTLSGCMVQHIAMRRYLIYTLDTAWPGADVIPPDVESLGEVKR